MREGGGRGAARAVGVGWEAGRRETAALNHTSDAARRGHGKDAHPVRLGTPPGRQVRAASADQSVDERLSVGAEAAALLHSPGEKAVVWVGGEHEGTVGTDLTSSSGSSSCSIHDVRSGPSARVR